MRFHGTGQSGKNFVFMKMVPIRVFQRIGRIFENGANQQIGWEL